MIWIFNNLKNKILEDNSIFYQSFLQLAVRKSQQIFNTTIVIDFIIQNLILAGTNKLLPVGTWILLLSRLEANIFLATKKMIGGKNPTLLSFQVSRHDTQNFKNKEDWNSIKILLDVPWTLVKLDRVFNFLFTSVIYWKFLCFFFFGWVTMSFPCLCSSTN